MFWDKLTSLIALPNVLVEMNSIVFMYVDDVLVVANSIEAINIVKQSIYQAYSIKDLRDVRFFLHIKICRTLEGFMLNQRKCLFNILKDCGLTSTKLT